MVQGQWNGDGRPHHTSYGTATEDTAKLPKAPQIKGIKFETQLQAEVAGGKMTTKGNALHIIKADSVVLRLVGATSFKDYTNISADPTQRCVDYFKRFADKSYEQSRAEHITDYQRLFQRVELRLRDGNSANTNLIPTDQRLRNVRSGRGNSVTNFLIAGKAVASGDFRIRARLKLDQLNSTAASMIIGGNHFGFDGRGKKLFMEGPAFGPARIPWGRPAFRL